MKRFLCFFLALALTACLSFTLAACNSEDSDIVRMSDNSSQSAVASEDKSVAQTSSGTPISSEEVVQSSNDTAISSEEIAPQSSSDVQSSTVTSVSDEDSVGPVDSQEAEQSQSAQQSSPQSGMGGGLVNGGTFSAH